MICKKQHFNIEDELRRMVDIVQAEYEKVMEYGDKPVSIYLSKGKQKVTDKPLPLEQNNNCEGYQDINGKDICNDPCFSILHINNNNNRNQYFCSAHHLFNYIYYHYSKQGEKANIKHREGDRQAMRTKKGEKKKKLWIINLVFIYLL